MIDSKSKEQQKLSELKDEDIDYSDIPELDEEFWSNARIVYPKSKTKNKTTVTLTIDNDVLRWFKDKDKSYQRLMLSVLHAYYLKHQKMEDNANETKLSDVCNGREN